MLVNIRDLLQRPAFIYSLLQETAFMTIYFPNFL